MTPLAQITKASLEAMIGRDAEGSRLEFKEDIPVHHQNAAEQAKSRVQRPQDAWWVGSSSVAPHGRNELLEEVVAFANAQGGQLILGMVEASEGPPVAAALRPLPRVAELELKFRNYLLEYVEPRLPYSAVRAIPTEADGSGLLVIEVEASRLGPHWVRTTRKPTIRRHTECAILSMTEMHDMVLRNVRRLDDVRTTLDQGMTSLGRDFHEFLLPRIDIQVFAATPEDRVQAWVQNGGISAVAFRIAIVAHEDLGIRRLSTFAGLIPPQTCIGEDVAGSVTTPRDMVAIWPSVDRADRFLGGVRQSSVWGTGQVEFIVRREGAVEVTFFYVNAGSDRWSLTSRCLVGALGCAFGIYDNLRSMSERLYVPAEVAVAVEARGNFPVASDSGPMARMTGGVLPLRSDFPRRTVADTEDFSDVMTETAQDLLDAANSSLVPGTPTLFRYLAV